MNQQSAANPFGGAGGAGRGAGGAGRGHGRGGQQNNTTHAAPPPLPAPPGPQAPPLFPPPRPTRNTTRAATGRPPISLRASGSSGEDEDPGSIQYPASGIFGPGPSNNPGNNGESSAGGRGNGQPAGQPADPSAALSAGLPAGPSTAPANGSAGSDGVQLTQPEMIEMTTKRVDELIAMVRRIEKVLQNCHHSKKRRRDEVGDDEEEEIDRVRSKRQKKAATGWDKGKAAARATNKGTAKTAGKGKTTGGGKKKVPPGKNNSAKPNGNGKAPRSGTQSASQPRSGSSGRIGCDYEPCSHRGADAPTFKCSVQGCGSLAHTECLPKTKRGHAPRSWKCNEHD